MTTFPGSPPLLKGGLVLLDPSSGAVLRVVSFQYNPETVSRSLTPQAASGDGDRSEALRLKGPPVETVKFDATLDATDALGLSASDPAARDARALGVQPALAALEILLYPESSQLQDNHRLAGLGTLEIAPATAPLVLLSWGRERVVPVRLTDLSVTEEAFDPALNPTLAKVSLGFRVLSVNDLEFSSKGAALYLLHHQGRERLARKAPSAALSTLGLNGIPS
jgi:hypothetical protein